MAPYPTTHLITYIHVFCAQGVQKRCLVMKIWLLFRFFKLVGGWSIFAHFGHFWPTLNQSSGPGRIPSGPLMVSPCYTYLIPCKKFWRAPPDDFLEILNTPMFGVVKPPFYDRSETVKKTCFYNKQCLETWLFIAFYNGYLLGVKKRLVFGHIETATRILLGPNVLESPFYGHYETDWKISLCNRCW